MCAPAGQALIFCSTNLHAGWHNELEVSRKTLLMAFAPQGVPCGSPFGQVEGQGLKFFRGLRPKMRPERAHLVPGESDWPYFFESPDGGSHPLSAAAHGAGAELRCVRCRWARG